MKKCMERLADIDTLLQKKERICFYGAGDIGKRLLELAEHLGHKNKIEKIYVTTLKDQCCLQGIPVEMFCGEKAEREMPVIVAVTSQYSGEILEYLKRFELQEVYTLSEDFIRELYEIDEDFFYEKILVGAKEYAEQEEKTETDIMFFSPPYWDVYAPFSAVPCLKARLQQEGYRVEQIDLGILCIHHLLKHSWKKRSGYWYSERFYEEKVKQYRYNTYQSYEEFCGDMWFFKGEEFPWQEVKRRYHELNMVQRCILNGFYHSIYGMDVSGISFDKCDNLEEAIGNADKRVLYEMLVETGIYRKLGCLPKVVGISVTSMEQFIPGCVMADFVRKCSPETKIIFGGSCADLFIKSSYPKKQDIKQYFDYFVVGEGETALVKLMDYLVRGQGALENIPNLVFVSEEGSIRQNRKIIEDVTILPPPDYDGLRLELYLAPETVLPYQTSRGCHYGQCAFCNHDEKYRHNYRTKNMKQVVEDLLFLSKKYQTQCFQFVDEAIRPDCFAVMVEEMEQHPEFKKMRWMYYSRVSRSYTEELLKKAQRNGCRMVMFGVETLNQRLLSFIKKGITADTSKHCLKLFKKCKIRTHAWMMCNLPSQNMEEVREDVAQLREMEAYIDAIGVAPFALFENTDMYNEPQKYNILEINEEDETRFVSHHDGQIIDKDEMLRFYREEYLKLQNEWTLMGDRYSVFFMEDGEE